MTPALSRIPRPAFLGLALAALAGLAFVPVASAQSASQPAATLVGTWRGPVITDGPHGIMTVVVAQEAGAWKTVTTFEGEGIPPSGDVRDFKVEGGIVTWAQSVGEFEVMYRAMVDGDMMKGDLEAYQGGTMVSAGTFELKKQP